MLTPGAGKVPRPLVPGHAGFCSLRVVPNQFGVNKVRCKGTGLRRAPKGAVGPYRAGAPGGAGRGQLLCWDELPCALEMDQQLWRWLPPQIGTILAPAHPQRGLEARNTSPFSPALLGVSLEKLLFARVLPLQRSTSSPRTAVTPIAMGQCGTGLALLRRWGWTKRISSFPQ